MMNILCVLGLIFGSVAGIPLSSSASESIAVDDGYTVPLELWNLTVPNATDTTVGIQWSRPVVAEGVVYIRELDVHTISDPNYHDEFGFGPPPKNHTNPLCIKYRYWS
jgi:hypothetical protein